MKILMTNDDGIEGEGLLVLASVLHRAGHDVTVVAPDRNNSAASHKLNMREPMFLNDCSKNKEFPAYSLTGSPADCVLFALKALKLRPDLILSGINDGMNLGSDCMYSGTVGAAQEGAQNNVPSIALSAHFHSTREEFERAAHIVLSHLNEWYGFARQAKGAINVNLPMKKEIIGVRLCKTARDKYNAEYLQSEDGSYLYHGTIPTVEPDEACDFTLFQKGFVTVTPLTLNMTDHVLLDGWKT